MKRIVVAALAVVVGVPAFAQAQSISFKQALAKATVGTSGMTLILGRAENKGTAKAPNPIWGFYFLTPYGNVIEKEISGTTGGLVKEKIITEITDKGKVNPKVVETLQVQTLTKLSMNRLLEIAQGKFPSAPEKYEVFLVGGELHVHVSGKLANGTEWVVVMNMTTGQIISTNPQQS